jgi:hypothetical protein
MDAHSSQSFTRTSQGRPREDCVEGIDYTIITDWDGNPVRYWHNSHLVEQIKDTPKYPEPDGDPSY